MLRRTEQGGPAVARNDGIAAAGGEFVAFLDSDDWWLPNKIVLQVACLDHLPEVGMISSEIDAVGPSGEPLPGGLGRVYAAWRRTAPSDLFTAALPLSQISEGLEGFVYWGDLFAAMLSGNLVHTSSVLIRRSRIDAAGAFDPSFTESGEDYDFHLRTCAAGPVAFLSIPTLRYRFGAPDQLTASQHHEALARNYLRALLNAADRHRDDPRVSARRLRIAIAGARAWYGEELLGAGHHSAARSELLRSLRRPGLRRLGMLTASLLPPRLSHILRERYRRIRSRAGRRTDS